MKKFLIKVNGNQYEVEVEEIRDGASAPQVTLSTPSAAPVPSPAPAQETKAAAPKKDSTVRQVLRQLKLRCRVPYSTFV